MSVDFATNGLQPLDNSFSLGGVVIMPTFKVAKEKCLAAQKFDAWTEKLIEWLKRHEKDKDILIRVSEAKILLSDHYHNMRRSADKSHQKFTGGGHICIFHVYDRMTEFMRQMELSVEPANLVEDDLRKKLRKSNVQHSSLHLYMRGFPSSDEDDSEE